MNRIACAWCGKELQAGEEPTSHGICDRCGKALVAQHEKGRAA